MKTVIKLFAALSVMLMIAGACGSSPSSSVDDLDTAIREASDYLNNNIPKGSKIVILNIQSSSPDLSDYIIDELLANAVTDKIFSVVDRQQLDAIRAEQNFQWSGEVDDNSAMEIGRFFGAQTIVSGAMSRLGNGYRMRIRALEVQTAQVQGQYNRNIAASPIIAALIESGGSTAGTAAVSGRSSPTTGAATTGAQTVQPAPQPRTPVTPLRWSIGDFKDQWGDSTGRKYVEYDGQVTADYADFWGPQRVVIRNVRFSRSQGLTFQSRMLESFTDWNAEMFLKASSGDEKRFRGRNYSNGSVRFEFSQDLANFLTDPEVKVMLVIGGDNSRYLFDFPPRFRDAYELLLSREN